MVALVEAARPSHRAAYIALQNSLRQRGARTRPEVARLWADGALIRAPGIGRWGHGTLRAALTTWTDAEWQTHFPLIILPGVPLTPARHQEVALTAPLRRLLDTYLSWLGPPPWPDERKDKCPPDFSHRAHQRLRQARWQLEQLAQLQHMDVPLPATSRADLARYRLLLPPAGPACPYLDGGPTVPESTA